MIKTIRQTILYLLFTASAVTANGQTYSITPHNDKTIKYFGDWKNSGYRHYSSTQYNACMLVFRGDEITWIGSTSPDAGIADVFIDGNYCRTVDAYSAKQQRGITKFRKSGLSPHRLHTIRIELREISNKASTGYLQDVERFTCQSAVNYDAYLHEAMEKEYAEIASRREATTYPSVWKPQSSLTRAPQSGVLLRQGLFEAAFRKNILYLKECFSRADYCCDKPNWSEWLPASNEGRMLAGAAGTLRWTSDTSMTSIVHTIVRNISKRARDDGYYNYYPEKDAYLLDSGLNSERKNYDRVFWTRGLLAAGIIGNDTALMLLRNMYDWFNRSPYLSRMLYGNNATNGLPGGGLVYHSPVGKYEDMLTAIRYYDQEYWMQELRNRQPLIISNYPGERPHCYELLGVEAIVDAYRATGNKKYLDAALGAWEIYKNNYKHIGGSTAICESGSAYPPKSYYINTGHNGETCGSAFWININSKLHHLFPDEEKYMNEIEESLYNVILAAQDEKGHIRYHNKLDGKKEISHCANTCCENSAVGLIAKLPEYVYSVAGDGLFINLFTPSEIGWKAGQDSVQLSMSTTFPHNNRVTIAVRMLTEKKLNIRIRVPAWNKTSLLVWVNGKAACRGKPGTYITLSRNWRDNDAISFTLAPTLDTWQYKGLDQAPSKASRFALKYGPVLMALQYDSAATSAIPVIRAAAEKLPALLTRIPGKGLAFSIGRHPGYVYRTYWSITDELFTCFPVVDGRRK